MASYFLLFSLVTVGSLITSLTGLGGGTLILAGLLLVYPPELAIPLHSFTQLMANGFRVVIFFKQIAWQIVGAYSLLMLPAAWSGAKLFEHFNPSILKLVVGSFILFSVLPFRWKSKSRPNLMTFTFLGGISGFLGVFVGAVGPMVTPFFNRLNLKREENLSTKSAGQMFLQFSKIIAFTGAAGVNFLKLKENIALIVVGTLVGIALSFPISKKISDTHFSKLVNFLLGLISVKIIIEGIREYFF